MSAGTGDKRLYAVVDCARDQRLHGWVEQCRERGCLLAGTLEPPLASAAPWLVAYEEGPLAEAWRTEGRDWGLFCRSAMDLASLRRHLRHFLQARLPDGRVVLFRFYDPRVWRVYWPTLPPAEQARWRGPDIDFL